MSSSLCCSWSPVQNSKSLKLYRKRFITLAVEDADLTFITATPYTHYTGNEVTVRVAKLKPENTVITVANGTVKQIAVGKFIVKVNKPGRVIVEVFNTKKNKSLGSASFVVMEKK